jgi:hypothetical protein
VESSAILWSGFGRRSRGKGIEPSLRKLDGERPSNWIKAAQANSELPVI